MLKFVCLVHINITICKYLAYDTCKHFLGILVVVHTFRVLDREICEAKEHMRVGTGDKMALSVLS